MEELAFWGEGIGGFQFQAWALSPPALVHESATGVTFTIEMEWLGGPYTLGVTQLLRMIAPSRSAKEE